MVKLRQYLANLCAVMLLCISYSGDAVPSFAASKVNTIEISAGEWPPFLSESLPEQGVIAHLIRDVFAQANIKVNFTFLPWGRAYHDTQKQKYAATAVWMFEKERTNHFLFSDAVLNERFVFFHLQSRPFDWQSVNDLKGLILGGGLAYSYGAEFDKALEDEIFEISRVNSSVQNFKRLSMNRIDVFAEEQSVGYHVLNNELADIANTITHHPKPLLINQSFLLFPKDGEKSQQLLSIFNQQLAQFKKDGRYQSYFNGLDRGDYRPAQTQSDDEP
ncbi:MAG: substrate-binding periplasmic protein [Pseudoalteromonas sp.]